MKASWIFSGKSWEIQAKLWSWWEYRLQPLEVPHSSDSSDWSDAGDGGLGSCVGWHWKFGGKHGRWTPLLGWNFRNFWFWYRYKIHQDSLSAYLTTILLLQCHIMPHCFTYLFGKMLGHAWTLPLSPELKMPTYVKCPSCSGCSTNSSLCSWPKGLSRKPNEPTWANLTKHCEWVKAMSIKRNQSPTGCERAWTHENLNAANHFPRRDTEPSQ